MVSSHRSIHISKLLHRAANHDDWSTVYQILTDPTIPPRIITDAIRRTKNTEHYNDNNDRKGDDDGGGSSNRSNNSDPLIHLTSTASCDRSLSNARIAYDCLVRLLDLDFGAVTRRSMGDGGTVLHRALISAQSSGELEILIRKGERKIKSSCKGGDGIDGDNEDYCDDEDDEDSEDDEDTDDDETDDDDDNDDYSKSNVTTTTTTTTTNTTGWEWTLATIHLLIERNADMEATLGGFETTEGGDQSSTTSFDDNNDKETTDDDRDDGIFREAVNGRYTPLCLALHWLCQATISFTNFLSKSSTASTSSYHEEIAASIITISLLLEEGEVDPTDSILANYHHPDKGWNAFHFLASCACPLSNVYVTDHGLGNVIHRLKKKCYDIVNEDDEEEEEEEEEEDEVNDEDKKDDNKRKDLKDADFYYDGISVYTYVFKLLTKEMTLTTSSSLPMLTESSLSLSSLISVPSSSSSLSSFPLTLLQGFAVALMTNDFESIEYILVVLFPPEEQQLNTIWLDEILPMPKCAWGGFALTKMMTRSSTATTISNNHQRLGPLGIAVRCGAIDAVSVILRIQNDNDINININNNINNTINNENDEDDDGEPEDEIFLAIIVMFAGMVDDDSTMMGEIEKVDDDVEGKLNDKWEQILDLLLGVIDTEYTTNDDNDGNGGEKKKRQQQRILDRLLAEASRGVSYWTHHHHVLPTLLRRGADPNVRSIASYVIDDVRPLHLVAAHRFGGDGVAYTDMLLNAGGDFNTVIKSTGEDPLVVALRSRNFRVVARLWSMVRKKRGEEEEEEEVTADFTLSFNIDLAILLGEASIACLSIEIFQVAVNTIIAKKKDSGNQHDGSAVAVTDNIVLSKLLLYLFDERKIDQTSTPERILLFLDLALGIIEECCLESPTGETMVVPAKDETSGGTVFHMLLRTDRGKEMRRLILDRLCVLLTTTNSEIKNSCNVISQPFSNTFGGYTPLHLACAHGCEESIKTLLRYGADPDAYDSKGRKPVYMIPKRLQDGQRIREKLQSLLS